MAFDDLPEIDNSAKYSETSERKLKERLNLTTGFNVRVQYPDTGIDFEVELIIESKASAWSFPIQLKSLAASFKLLANGHFFTFSFESSRLNYLLRRSPSFGLIVIYSEKDDFLIYDFADRIYDRLMEERNSEDWKDLRSVNIHIPAENILNKDAVSTIYSIFLQRFEQHAIMYQDHGRKYKLPLSGITESNEDPIDIGEVKSILLKYGIGFLNMYDIRIVLELITRLTHQEILADEKLMMMAVIVYAEFGFYSEAILYYAKLSKRNPEMVKNEISLQFAKLKADLALANINRNQFEQKLGELSLLTKNDINSITIEINRLFYELLDIKPMHSMPDNIYERVMDVFQRILSSEQPDEMKRLLELWNTENLMLFFGGVRHRAFSELRILESLGGNMSMEERKNKARLLVNQEIAFSNRLEGLFQYAKSNNKQLLIGHIWALNNRATYSKQIDYYVFQNQERIEKISQDLLFNNIVRGLQAYNIFLDLDHRLEAYHVLCTAIELIDISRKMLGYIDQLNRDDLIAKKEYLELQLEIAPYQLSIDNIINSVEHNDDSYYSPDSMSYLKDLDDAQLAMIARITVQANNYPQSKYLHILNELKAYRYFFNSGADRMYYLHLSPSNVGPSDERYFAPSRFIIKSRLTGVDGPEGTDVAKLLSDWGYPSDKDH